MAQVKVSKATSVASLQRQFRGDFDCTLVIYHGNKIAEGNLKIQEISKTDNAGGTLELGARSRVGNVESYFHEKFGIKVEIKSADGSTTADKNMTLTQAGKMGSGQIVAEKAPIEKKSKQSTESTRDTVAPVQIAADDGKNKLESNAPKIKFNVDKFTEVYSVQDKRNFDVDEWESKIDEEFNYKLDFIVDFLPSLDISVLENLKFHCEWVIKFAKQEIPAMKKEVKKNPVLQNFLNALNYEMSSNSDILKEISKRIKSKK